MKRMISKLIPDELKHRVRQSDCYNRRRAIHLASSSKRIDICAAQFAHTFHLAGQGSIEGKTCLEIGAGWVLTHALVCYLLGAEKVIATDVAPLAQPKTLSFAVGEAVASIPRDLLAPFSDHARVRERFNRLLSIPQFSFDTLSEIGIEYRCPVNLAEEKLDTPVDFIYSHSVLEHVPSDDVPSLLGNLVATLAEGGTMIHCIHLEDHKDIEGHPFDFLSSAESHYTRGLQSDRGNRIRSSEWRRLFDDAEGTRTDFIYSYSRLDKPLPESIDPSVSYSDESDLRTSHIGVYTRKER